MKKLIAMSWVFVNLSSMLAHAKTVVCHLTNHEGETSFEITGPYRRFSQIIIDTELKEPGTDQAYLDVKYKNGNDLRGDVFFQSYQEVYNSQKITILDRSRIKVISKSYFNKEIFDLDLVSGTLKIDVTKILNIGIVAITPRVFHGSKSTYQCSI